MLCVVHTVLIIGATVFATSDTVTATADWSLREACGDIGGFKASHDALVRVCSNVAMCNDCRGDVNYSCARMVWRKAKYLCKIHDVVWSAQMLQR